MKKYYCLLPLLFMANIVLGQSHLLPRFIRCMLFVKDSSKRSSIIPLPVLSSGPETGLEFGISLLSSFYTDTLDRSTRVSNVFAYGSITTKGQNRASISTSYWTSKNLYHYTATIGYLNFPGNFYGIGNSTRAANAELVDEKRYKFSVGAEKLIAKNLYVGIVAGAANYQFHSTVGNGVFESDAVQNPKGGTNVLAGPSFTFDTRNKNTYTTSGIYLTTDFNLIKGIYASNAYSGGLLSVKFSQFFLLNKRLVLAYDLYDNSLTGMQSPFYLLPAMGSDELMRGYYNGRYRDRNYLAGQTELRYRISDRFGAVGFLGTGTVFADTFDPGTLKPDYGGGIRYFFDVEKGLSIRLDYGLGEKLSGEQRQSGLYIALGEAF